MSLEVEGLPKLASDPEEPRLFETWLPSKVIKSYSLRYTCSLHKCNLALRLFCSSQFCSCHTLSAAQHCGDLLQNSASCFFIAHATSKPLWLRRVPAQGVELQWCARKCVLLASTAHQPVIFTQDREDGHQNCEVETGSDDAGKGSHGPRAV